MKRAIVLLVGLAAASFTAPVGARQTTSQGPAPQIQNGRVESRPGTSIDREIAGASPKSSTEPVWIAWRVPMVSGDRDVCSWYSDRLGATRGMWLDDSLIVDPGRPRVTPPTGPIPLEAGTGLVVFARAIGGAVERLRTAGDDCPMDAGGRTVIWLSSITPAESIRFLTALAGPSAADRNMYDSERTTATTAVRAIGLHADRAADSTLETIAAKHTDASVRRQAATSLGLYRGAFGVGVLTKMLAATPADTTRNLEERRSLIRAIGQSRDAAGVEALRGLTKEADARSRSDAWYYYVTKGGAATIPEALRAIASDNDESVRKRAVSAISQLPGDAGLPALLQLARATDNLVARKEAVSALSQSKDPRAIALMEEILKR
jgi:hypothetical protein